jgi:HEAT repeat protein
MPTSAELLNNLQQAPDRIELWEAAKALINASPNKRTKAALKKILLGTGDPELRAAAAYVLGFWYASDAVPALFRIVSDPTEPAVVRDHAAEAIGEIAAVYRIRGTAVDVLIKGTSNADLAVAYS